MYSIPAVFNWIFVRLLTYQINRADIHCFVNYLL